MTRAEFTRRFAEIVSAEPESLTPDRAMNSVSGWDSVTILSAMILIDSELGLTIRPDILSQARTYGDLVAAVSERLES